MNRIGDECGTCIDCGLTIIFHQFMQDAGVTNPARCHACAMDGLDRMQEVVTVVLGRALADRGLDSLDDDDYIHALMQDEFKRRNI